ncbi:hypothetical protein [Hymenobacter bucti]|uniref:Uncharacterized protein n=1 Tax=Hymenobacter bucti TaxID=1844114 RepID=A0ABW4QNN9_9BACT
MNFRSQLLAFAFGAITTLAAPAAHAQGRGNAQFGRPAWGPATPAGAQYYYVPEIDGYYDLAARNYMVQRNGRWVAVATVPGYNTANFHPVVVDYRGRQPWTQYRDHHARYYRPVAVQPRPVVVQPRPVVVRQRLVVVRQRTVVIDRDNRGRNRR